MDFRSKMMLAFLLLACITTSAQLKEISLWPTGAPGSEGKTGKEKIRTVGNDQVVSNIHNPSITPYLPAKEKATGAAVIIAPGGGHRELWITHEGYNEAKWLSDRALLHSYSSIDLPVIPYLPIL